MQDWKFLFGDTLTEAVRGIIYEVMHEGMPESIRRGIERLEGIDYFLMCMQCKGTLGPDAIIRIGNEKAKLERLHAHMIAPDWETISSG